jgi:putative nucleotidyltransferase with HDIG domain
MMDPMTLQQFRADVIARKSLPTIPPVLTGIIALIDDDRAGAKKLVELIERDQALTARLLRLANSAFFGQARKVSTIPRAVLLLGFSTVRNLALGVKVWDTLGTGVSRKELESLWSHAVQVASAARTIARQQRQVNADEAFTTGLLHDVGQLVLALRFKALYWDTVHKATSTEHLAGLEQSALGVDHAEVGSWLLEAWNLPAVMVEAVRRHHDTEVRTGLAGVIAVSSRLAHRTDFQTGTLAEDGLPILQAAGLRLEDWQAAAAEVAQNAALLSLVESHA